MTANLRPSASTPHLESRGSLISARNENCFLVRHTPHPRRVCHIKGLNNIPICTVNDDDESVFRTLNETPISKCTPEECPRNRSAQSPVHRMTPTPQCVRLPPRPHSEPCRKTHECFRTSSENPLVIKKGETKAKKPPSPSKASSTAGSCFSEVPRTKAHAKQNTVCIPNYLDQEIKILAKLCEILHTDSLGEVLQWLLHASTKEKEWVSALVHSELAEINFLIDGCRRSASAEPVDRRKSPTVAKSTPSVKSSKNSPAKPKMPMGVEERHQAPRVSSQRSEENKEVLKGTEQKQPLFLRRNTMKIPVKEYFNQSNSPLPSNTQESRTGKARSTQQENDLCSQRGFYPFVSQR
ncbi:uncharacterized protein C4orf17 homolog [Perognathus longimembris pacificus]|uniref:uncharacterized protein C4orf17 homolog n=1 Tax=Perognathus longimembris pacificus TaxID=214514 RepID=UPI00201A1EB4|nr:uncharacterized protein C4orf17 homolog [Perognathus longimembris pacificus]